MDIRPSSIEVDGTKLLVDPFFAPNNPLAPVTADGISADYILQTHGHGDHIADTIPIAKRTGAQVICNFEINNWLQAQWCEQPSPDASWRCL